MSLSGVDLNLLVALDALLTERNVTRAAERMSLGQPAMSAALARLRKQFGDPLLVREGRSYGLTTLAESLLDKVEVLGRCRIGRYRQGPAQLQLRGSNSAVGQFWVGKSAGHAYRNLIADQSANNVALHAVVPRIDQ